MRVKDNRKKMRERWLFWRCAILMAGAIFFSLMAFAKARGGDYSGGRPGDEWAFPEEDEYDVMSDDDHVLAARMRKRLVGERPVYYRKKASRVHDSVTIVIAEMTSSEISSSNDLKRDSSQDFTLSNWLTPSFSGGLGATQHGESAGGNTPKIGYTNSRKHKSDSTIDRAQAIDSTLTGEVIQVHPNGYLVVEAKKTVNINGEEQTLLVTGTVNPDHMDSNSSVKAEHIMNMSVRYTGNGPMTRMDKRGWGSKIIDFVNPF